MKKDSYDVVKCGNGKCSHLMGTAYRHLRFPDRTTPKENIHNLLDETLSIPLVYFCDTCNHFTLIGRNEHIIRVLERAGQA